ncbi:hypothetical protein GGR56DRAFT_327278 [Xylariaceae sp. FL0804]|nr:hypothetical protein GGR56DRAFT_327278 [Xylariaceae sp. FL0804]
MGRRRWDERDRDRVVPPEALAPIRNDARLGYVRCLRCALTGVMRSRPGPPVPYGPGMMKVAIWGMLLAIIHLKLAISALPAYCQIALSLDDQTGREAGRVGVAPNARVISIFFFLFFFCFLFFRFSLLFFFSFIFCH